MHCVFYSCKGDEFAWSDLIDIVGKEATKKRWDKLCATKLLYRISRMNISDQRFAGCKEWFIYCDLMDPYLRSVKTKGYVKSKELPLVMVMKLLGDKSWLLHVVFVRARFGLNCSTKLEHLFGCIPWVMWERLRYSPQNPRSYVYKESKYVWNTSVRWANVVRSVQQQAASNAACIPL